MMRRRGLFHFSRHFGAGIAVALVAMVAPVSGQESFRVELGRDGETIADMRPVFLTFESRPIPAISPAEVARRYQRLFDSSDEPEVRIDALNRLANIQQASGQVLQPDDLEEQRLYREVLGSYESIIESGAFQGKLDELLYQMAKAHAFVGDVDASVQRLKQLTGLYPNSSLVPEARFRIAESAFAAGRYSEAEAEYTRLTSGPGSDALKLKAKYMLGWSQYKQGIAAWNRAADAFLAVLDQNLPTSESLGRLTASDRELVDDTLRVLALMAASDEGLATLTGWLNRSGPKPYGYLVYDALADHLASQERYANSVAVSQRFADNHGNHPQVPAFLAQVVEVWERAGQSGSVRQAKADYVARLGAETGYQRMSDRYQSLWVRYGRALADYHYVLGQERASKEMFATAADYYERISERDGAPGETLRLAGDARLQAGEFDRAISAYRQAAYGAQGYGDNADSGWAALAVMRDGLEQRIPFSVALAQLSTEADRFAVAFPEDTRLSGLFADLANRWLDEARPENAAKAAERVLEFDPASPDERYSAWLVLADVHTSAARHGLAEHAWRQAANLLSNHPIAGVGADEAERIQQQLATAIYRQGEAAQQSGETDVAVAHFRRVDSVSPGSVIAIKGRYDAANTLLLSEQWQSAVNEFNRFRTDYPDHELTDRIGDKLVLAYTASDQPLRAAEEHLSIAKGEADPWPRRLKAAELLHAGDDWAARDAIYGEFLQQSPSAETATDHLRLQTMRQRLLESGVDSDAYREQMVVAELDSQWHSKQTLAWAAQSALVLGRSAAAEFVSITLDHPLEQSLQRKRVAMERAQRRFTQAEELDPAGVSAETLFRRAELFREMAQALMNSEVPGHLNDLEQAQYRMLLEEEAYPFEERAIELHAENHQRLADAGINEWIEKSLEVLASLFPGRYSREVQWMTWKGEAQDDV